MSAIATAIVAAGIGGSLIASNQAKKSSSAAIKSQEESEATAISRQEEAKIAARAEKEKAYTESLGLIQKEAGRTLPILSDLPEAQKLKGTLEERLAGRGVGFRPEVLSAATAPYAAARREGFQRYEVPAISAAASARGLGRSTIPVAQIGLKAQEAERDIEQRVSDVTLANEQQIRQEINTALEQYKQFTGAELSSQQLKAEFERTGQFALAEMVSKQGSDLAIIELATGNNLSNISMQSGNILSNLIQTRGMQEAANTMKMAEIVGSAALGYATSRSAAESAANAKETNDILRDILTERGISSSSGARVSVANQ